jgi:hypothetical protein
MRVKKISMNMKKNKQIELLEIKNEALEDLVNEMTLYSLKTLIPNLIEDEELEGIVRYDVLPTKKGMSIWNKLKELPVSTYYPIHENRLKEEIYVDLAPTYDVFYYFTLIKKN